VNQQLFKKHLNNYYENTLHWGRKPPHKDEWYTVPIPLRMHCAYCNMVKGTSQAEVTSNKPAALAIFEFDCTMVWQVGRYM